MARFEYPPKLCTSNTVCYMAGTYNAVWLLHGWCHVKLLPSCCIMCTPIQPLMIPSQHMLWHHVWAQKWPCLTGAPWKTLAYNRQACQSTRLVVVVQIGCFPVRSESWKAAEARQLFPGSR